MSKRSFILLIIILMLIIGGFFAYLYMQQFAKPGEDSEGTNFLSKFNPFGSNTTNKPGDQGDGETPTDISDFVPPENPSDKELVKVSSVPVAGFSVFLKERYKEVPPEAEGETAAPAAPQTELAPALRYVDRVTGNIFQTFADKIEERKFTATIIPKIYEAYFGNKSEAVLMRYLKGDYKTIQTFWGILPKEILGGDSTEAGEVRGTFLPDNITSMNVSPDKLSVFYLFNSGEGSVGTTLEIVTGKKVQVFDSPFTEWLTEWPNSQTITFNTKPSFTALGYLYKLDLKSKNFNQILGNILGLTSLMSPDGKLVIYTDNTLALRVYNVATKETVLLGIKTMPEKCVWGRASDTIYCSVPKNATFVSEPDNWYQGISSWNDQIWRVDVATANASLIGDIASLNGGEEIDGIKLALDESENYLFFVNKKDSLLWRLRLN